MTESSDTRRIVVRRRPDLVPVVDRLVDDMADDDDVDRIQLVLVDELLEYGLDVQSQHSEYGRHVELLIDAANRARPEFRTGTEKGVRLQKSTSAVSGSVTGVLANVPMENIDEFAEAFFEELRRSVGDRAARLSLREELGALPLDQLDAAIFRGGDRGAEVAWTLVQGLVERAPSDEALSYIGAGPLEDLIVRHGARFAERILAAARASSEFRRALGAAWHLDRLPPETRQRIEVLLDRADPQTAAEASGVGRRTRRHGRQKGRGNRQ